MALGLIFCGPQDYSIAVGKYFEEIHLVTFSIVILVN